MAIKIDLKRELKHYTAHKVSAQFTVVDVLARQFLIEGIDGRGDPNTARSYQEALDLYTELLPAARRTIIECGNIARKIE
jgi:hypothetical protein